MNYNTNNEYSNKNLFFSIILIIVIIIGVVFAISVTNGSNSEKELSNAEVVAASYVEEIERYMQEYELNHNLNPGYYSIEIIPGKTYKVEELDSIIGVGVEKPTSGIIKIGTQKNVESAKVVINGLGVICTGKSCEATGTDGEEFVEEEAPKKTTTTKKEVKKSETKSVEPKKEESKKETVTPTPTPTPAPAPVPQQRKIRYRVTTLTCQKTRETCNKNIKTCQKRTTYKVTKEHCVNPCPSGQDACLTVMPYSESTTEYADTCTVEHSPGLSCGPTVCQNPPSDCGGVDTTEYITKCEPQDVYEFSTTNVINNVMSCTNKSVSCNASTVGQENVSCDCTAKYSFKTSITEADTCSVGNGFNCSSSTNNQSYVSNCQEITE